MGCGGAEALCALCWKRFKAWFVLQQLIKLMHSQDLDVSRKGTLLLWGIEPVGLVRAHSGHPRPACAAAAATVVVDGRSRGLSHGKKDPAGGRAAAAE